MTQARQVRDLRDKIYGLLSLVKNKNSLPYLPTYDIDARPLIERARLRVQGDTVLALGVVVDGIEAVGTQIECCAQETGQSYDDVEWTQMGLIHTKFRKMVDKSTAYGSSEDVTEEVRSHKVVGGRDTDYRRRPKMRAYHGGSETDSADS
ncbi:hypothetical protein HO133_007328 [Letharia lupina]|uniref:Uncharacterized protein n=1 Tax=Letharia lupina TaxID=560253 RepID=A0A8H6FIR2_9LECA|nr:uncharacterized protein HO133_007328 [Letharia lupina]KAF6229212.1 hypothetical protein HO133_007328 [Letharia lupina]